MAKIGIRVHKIISDGPLIASSGFLWMLIQRAELLWGHFGAPRSFQVSLEGIRKASGSSTRKLEHADRALRCPNSPAGIQNTLSDSLSHAPDTPFRRSTPQSDARFPFQMLELWNEWIHWATGFWTKCSYDKFKHPKDWGGFIQIEIVGGFIHYCSMHSYK